MQSWPAHFCVINPMQAVAPRTRRRRSRNAGGRSELLHKARRQSALTSMKTSMTVALSLVALLAVAPTASALRTRLPYGAKTSPLLGRTRLVASTPEVSSKALSAVSAPAINVPQTIVPTEEKKTPLLRKVFSPLFIRWSFVAAGCTSTWLLNNVFGLGPVIGCGSVLVFNALFLPQHLIIPATCGSFTGMASVSCCRAQLICAPPEKGRKRSCATDWNCDA
eukprot:scaffold1849_cov239-Pinguiococcus_pyrenoidosus.AAC.2